MSSYVLGAGAALDLEEIWDFIADDSIDQADRWVARLFDAFDTIAQSPRIGHRRKDLTDFDVFFWPVGNYLIIYRSAGAGVEIVAVTQGSRNLPGFLRRRIP